MSLDCIVDVKREAGWKMVALENRMDEMNRFLRSSSLITVKLELDVEVMIIT